MGMLIYHVRGRYYQTYLDHYPLPNYAGRMIVKDIPSDPDEYNEWKRAKIAFYLEQEKLIHRLAQEDPTRDPEDFEYWGYAVKPSAAPHKLTGLMEYIYTVDLDFDWLIIEGCCDHDDSRNYGYIIYCLDNIPRWIFDLPMVDGRKEPPVGDEEDEEYGEYLESFSNSQTEIHPIMLMVGEKGIADEYWGYTRPKPAPDQDLLQLYSRFSPRLVSMAPKVVPERDLVWRSFQLLLLADFLKHFLEVFPDIRGFGMHPVNIPVFHQMAFAILCLAQGRNFEFQNENSLYKILIGGNKDATPTWDPPTEDHYWLGKILVVLEPYPNCEEHRHAAIGKVIKFASAQLQEKSDVQAVVFSIESIILVNINHTAQGLPQVTYSSDLPLFTSGVILYHKPFMPPTTGVMALLDIFSPPSPQPASYPFPTEICQQIFLDADPDTQRALECSCRLFYIMAQEFPRVGDWTLLRHIEGSESEFVAVSSLTRKKERIKIESKRPRHNYIGGGLEVILWSGGRKLVLEMPLYNISVVGGALA